MTNASAIVFRDLCNQQGLAVTHQRQVIYEVMQSMPGHPSPEEVFVQVKELVPAISLATVYKNIHIFLTSGILREVSPHHGSLRVEMNSHPHHHLVCTQCRSIQDISEAELLEFSGCRPAESTLPGGFLAQRLSVDVLGLCSRCQQSASSH
ncbi:Fur family transcriptional regulator [Acidicapsa ligni]|uniref:Fur family transcriptional regulator n=1 Tax=Acidicapsa ligni TaxID=542300 RepID=UPI0021E01638|nr:transcriptional repressor [Acidicapsa ligni]